jgi:hypothetical protein
MQRTTPTLSLVECEPRRRPFDSTAEWGGFVSHRRDGRVLHVKLTGRLSKHTVQRVHRALLSLGPTDGPSFLLLDSSHLRHIPMDAAAWLQECERVWRGLDAVTLWCGLTPYLANLLVLASFHSEPLPAFSDVAAAMRAVRAVAGDTAGTARLRLSAWGGLRH